MSSFGQQGIGSPFKMQGYGNMPMPPAMPDAGKQLYGHVSSTDSLNGASFGDTIRHMIGKASETIGSPDALAIESVKTGKIDIHEVMIALGKAGVAFKMITAVTQKVVGAFDKLSSMQV
jgi:flagellar hook-basal body complex protein FliE